MKRSEILAWTGMVGLLVIGVILLVGGVMYNVTMFWAGMMLAFAQALIVGLAGWGLALARQREQLEEDAGPSVIEGFRMSVGDEARREETVHRAMDAGGTIKTLETGFQRMLVGLSAVALLGIAAYTAYLVYLNFGWARAHADQPFPIAGTFDKPRGLDALALVIGLGAAGGYLWLYWLTRRRTGARDISSDAVNSNFTLGATGMAVLGIAAIGAYFQKPYLSETAALVIAALAALQGLELFVNALRSYAAVEEMDQEAVDLQAQPLVPMLSSVWLGGVRMLFQQSVGLSRETDKGVIARLMPRTIGALIVIGIGSSCFRSVPAGEMAVQERLGDALTKGDGSLALLPPGLHVMCPWPIDRLVLIPTQVLQLTDVGVELHGEKPAEANGDTSLEQKVDFQFWTIRPGMNETDPMNTASQFVTADQQMLETYVAVLWRVADPAKFYNHLSHSDFYAKSEGETTTKPIYEELVQQWTGFAVTRTFAIHTMDQIMTVDRQEVEAHCKQILQQKLDDADSGIQVMNLNITDLHPPYGLGSRVDSMQPVDPKLKIYSPLGPANAFEFIVDMMQEKELITQKGKKERIITVDTAQGDADKMVNEAKTYQQEHVAAASADAAQVEAVLNRFKDLPESEREFMIDLADRRARYSVLTDLLPPVNKVVVDPRVNNLDVIQATEKSEGLMRPPLMAPR